MLLVVEDHADSRKVLVRLPAMEGYQAFGVEDGLQALTFLRTFRPRLILLDCAMPGMDGLEVLAEIRKTPDLAAIPVLMFSAYDGHMRQKAIAAGVDGYVMKGSMDWAVLYREIIRLAGPPKAVSSVGNKRRIEEFE